MKWNDHDFLGYTLVLIVVSCFGRVRITNNNERLDGNAFVIIFARRSYHPLNFLSPFFPL